MNHVARVPSGSGSEPGLTMVRVPGSMVPTLPPDRERGRGRWGLGRVGLVLALFVAGAFVAYRRDREKEREFGNDRRAIGAMRQESEGMMARARDELRANGEYRPTTAQIAEHVERMTAHVRAGGESAPMAEAVAHLMQEMGAAAIAMREAEEAFLGAGAYDCSGGCTPEQLRERLAMLELLGARDRALGAVLTGAPATIDRRLAASGVSVRDREAAVRGFTASARYQGALEFRAATQRSIALGCEFLTVLRDRFGTWTWDAEDGLLFEDGADQQAFDVLWDRLIEAEEVAAELQLKLVGG